jgi:hypothetical protein
MDIYDCRDCGQEIETYPVPSQTFASKRSPKEGFAAMPCQNPGCPRYGMEPNIGQAVPRP